MVRYIDRTGRLGEEQLATLGLLHPSDVDLNLRLMERDDFKTAFTRRLLRDHPKFAQEYTAFQALLRKNSQTNAIAAAQSLSNRATAEADVDARDAVLLMMEAQARKTNSQNLIISLSRLREDTVKSKQTSIGAQFTKAIRDFGTWRKNKKNAAAAAHAAIQAEIARRAAAAAAAAAATPTSTAAPAVAIPTPTVAPTIAPAPVAAPAVPTSDPQIARLLAQLEADAKERARGQAEAQRKAAEKAAAEAKIASTDRWISTLTWGGAAFGAVVIPVAIGYPLLAASWGVAAGVMAFVGLASGLGAKISATALLDKKASANWVTRSFKVMAGPAVAAAVIGSVPYVAWWGDLATGSVFDFSNGAFPSAVSKASGQIKMLFSSGDESDAEQQPQQAAAVGDAGQPTQGQAQPQPQPQPKFVEQSSFPKIPEQAGRAIVMNASAIGIGGFATAAYTAPSTNPGNMDQQLYKDGRRIPATMMNCTEVWVVDGKRILDKATGKQMMVAIRVDGPKGAKNDYIPVDLLTTPDAANKRCKGFDTLISTSTAKENILEAPEANNGFVPAPVGGFEGEVMKGFSGSQRPTAGRPGSGRQPAPVR